MARWVMGLIAAVFVAGIYSSVCACDRAKRAEVARHSLESTPVVMVKVRTTVDDAHRVVCTSAEDEKCGPVHAVVHTAKVARTLGRAFVTTVGAVVNTLVQVAVERTAAVV